MRTNWIQSWLNLTLTYEAQHTKTLLPAKSQELPATNNIVPQLTRNDLGLSLSPVIVSWSSSKSIHHRVIIKCCPCVDRVMWQEANKQWHSIGGELVFKVALELVLFYSTHETWFHYTSQPTSGRTGLRLDTLRASETGWEAVLLICKADVNMRNKIRGTRGSIFCLSLLLLCGSLGVEQQDQNQLGEENKNHGPA